MNVLLIDDHPMILEGYASILDQPSYVFHKILSCEQLYNWLLKGNIPDVALIDYNLPSFVTENLYNGSDCAALINQYAPNCKNIIITAHEEATVLYQIFRKSSLSGLIVKADFVTQEVRDLIKGELKEPYLSGRVKEALNEIRIQESLISYNNIEILMYLSQGFKVNQISGFVKLSTFAIQKRVNKMLRDFDVTNHAELIQICKARNII